MHDTALSKRVRHHSSSVRTAAVSRLSGDVTMTMTVGITATKRAVTIHRAVKDSSPVVTLAASTLRPYVSLPTMLLLYIHTYIHTYIFV